MKTLVLLIASIPDDLTLFLPAPPADCGPHVYFAWSFARQMMPQFYEYAVAHGMQQRADLLTMPATDGRAAPFVQNKLYSRETLLV